MRSDAPRTTRPDMASEGDRGTLTGSGGEDRNFPSRTAYEKQNKTLNTVRHPPGGSSLWICCCPHWEKKVRYLLSKQITRLARIPDSSEHPCWDGRDWSVLSLTVLVLRARGAVGHHWPADRRGGWSLRSAMQSAWKPPIVRLPRLRAPDFALPLSASPCAHLCVHRRAKRARVCVYVRGGGRGGCLWWDLQFDVTRCCPLCKVRPCCLTFAGRREKKRWIVRECVRKKQVSHNLDRGSSLWATHRLNRLYLAWHSG